MGEDRRLQQDRRERVQRLLDAGYEIVSREPELKLKRGPVEVVV